MGKAQRNKAKVKASMDAWSSTLPDGRAVINVSALLASKVTLESLVGQEAFVPDMQVGGYPRPRVQAAWTQEEVESLETQLCGGPLDDEPLPGPRFSSGIIRSVERKSSGDLLGTMLYIEGYGSKHASWVWVLKEQGGADVAL
jgi:hypothetical protein